MPDEASARPPLAVTAAEAARLLRVSARTLYNLVKRGELPRVMIGSAVRYSPADLAAFIDRNREGNRG